MQQLSLVKHCRLPTEVAKVMYEFAKQGEQAEVIELTKTALMAMNVADLDAEQAVKYLTSATLQLNMAASESSHFGCMERSR